MNQPSQEDLLGYVLGALDAQEHEQVQRSIDNDPDLEDQLLEIKNSLLPLEWIDHQEGPPVGLARRTCEWVAQCEHAWRDVLPPTGRGTPPSFDPAEAVHPLPPIPDPPLTDPLALPLTPPLAGSAPDPLERNRSELPALTLPERSEPPIHRHGGSHADFLTGVVALAVLLGILFPAISWTRHHARIAACQQKMSRLGTAFLEYSDLQHSGQFVAIPDDPKLGVAGIFAPTLKAAGLIEDADVLCPDAAAREDFPPTFPPTSLATVPGTPRHIPTLAQVEAAEGEDLLRLQRGMGGDYGYTLGYVEGGRYHAPQNLGRSYSVLLADTPSLTTRERISRLHGSQGQNCLFEDGRVVFVRGAVIGSDPLFENDLGLIASGLHPGDNVIAPSSGVPVVVGFPRDAHRAQWN